MITRDILLIEDRMADAKLIQLSLKRYGFEGELLHVTRGFDGLKAMASWKDRQPIVLLDLNLPGLSGHEVLREIRTNDEMKDVPVFIMTSSCDPQDFDESIENEANWFFTKPSQIEGYCEIWNRIETFAAGK